MIGDDWRGRARARAGARHGAQERDAWLGTTRAGARHGAQERHAWLGTTRAGARGRTRARATMHKNTMIEDDARGRHDAQEFQKSPNRETHGFPKKKSKFLHQRGERGLRGYPRGVSY